MLDYKEHENGPALLFRYLDPNAVRFDQYLATDGHKLTTDQRLDMLRQVADAIRYAHRKRVIHRALSPQSILVTDAASPTPRLQVYNWQVGVRETASTSGRVTERRGSGRGPSPRLHVARGDVRLPQGHRGVGRVLAGGHRLPPVRLPATRRPTRPNWPGSCGSRRG